MGTCTHCDNVLVPKQASIPESIICYKAGDPDPEREGNRLVTEWHCPVHGIVFSPGGGICRTVTLQGGPWDGRKVIWNCDTEQEILVTLPDGSQEKHLYRRNPDIQLWRYEYVSKKEPS